MRFACAVPHLVALGVVVGQLAYCLLWTLWVPIARFSEPAAWVCSLLAVRKLGATVAVFATFPGSFKQVRSDVEREYSRRLLHRLEHSVYAVETWWIALHPRTGGVG